MTYNEAETRYFLIDPILRQKGYDDRQRLKLETPAPVEPTGPRGRRRRGSGRTDYLLCVQVGEMPRPLPVAVLEAKKQTEDPLKGMQQAKGYSDCRRHDVKYVFATNGRRYGEFDKFTGMQAGPFPFPDFPSHPDLTARYARGTGIAVDSPEAAILFMADSPAYPQSRYYQDAAIRAAFEKIIRCRQTGEPAHVLLAMATGSGKTIIADERLPATLTGDWLEDESNLGKPFPTFARLLAPRGTPEGDSRYSWTVDFAPPAGPGPGRRCSRIWTTPKPSRPRWLGARKRSRRARKREPDQRR